MVNTYYVVRDKKIIIQSVDFSVINRFTKDACEEIEDKQNRDLGFTVYERIENKVFHHHHTWLSSSDGCAHSRSFSPKHEVTEMFNKEIR